VENGWIIYYTPDDVVVICEHYISIAGNIVVPFVINVMNEIVICCHNAGREGRKNF